MAEFIHSILSPAAAVAADGDEIIDLPVNPLSLILIQIAPLQESGTITTHRLMEVLLAAVENVEVSHKGASVVNASGVDLGMVAMLYHGASIWQSNAVETDDDRRSLVLPIFLSKSPYDLDECFPATRRGEFQLTVTWDIAATGFDGLRRSIETIELPGATPSNVQKVTTLAQTLAATGQQDLDLPIGNFLRAILLFGTTAFAGATPTPTLGELSFLLSNRQQRYSGSDYETLRGLHGLRGLAYPPDGRHIHSVDASGAGREDTLEPEVGASIDDQYVLMDFDPRRDDGFGIETAEESRVHVRLNAEVADAVRVLPIERVAVERFLEV